MNRIEFKVNGQSIVADRLSYASDTVNIVDCEFVIKGPEWTDLDYIKAVFDNKRVGVYEQLLVDGKCVIPWEVLTEVGPIRVNLVGVKLDGEVITERMTTYKIDAILVKQKVSLSGQNTLVPTPSAFDQYVAIVKGYRDEAEGFKNRTEELASDVEHIIEGVAEEVEQKIQPKLDVKADRSDVERVESKVNGKADRSEITRLENEIVDKASIGQLAEVTREVANKQNKLVAGANITIEGDVISAEGGLAEVEWAEVKNKPTEFKPSAHRHSTSDVDGLNADLNDLDNRLENQEQLLATKVDKVQGKGLSTNDYTDAEKLKLRGLENYDDTEVRDAINTLDEDLQSEKQAIESLESGKQDKLIAGDNITIAEDGKTISASGGGGDDKQWNHTRISITTDDEVVSKITIHNQQTVSEIVITGYMVCDAYDGFAVYIGSKKLTDNLNPTVDSNKRYVSLKISSSPLIRWFGFGGASQWNNRDALSHFVLPYELKESADNGDIIIGSNWLNKPMLIGTYFDVYWR